MCCAEFVAKYALFLSNLGFLILGLALFGLGLAVSVTLQGLHDILVVNFIPVSLVLIGIAVFVIAFLGCWGAISKSIWMLITYSIIVGILAALSTYISVVLFGQVSSIAETATGWVVSAFGNENVSEAFLYMEFAFQCCGTTGPDSYLSTNQTLPLTCCPNPFFGAEGPCELVNAFTMGCADRVGSWFEIITEVMGIVMAVVVGVQVVAVILALFLSHSYWISNKKRRRNVY